MKFNFLKKISRKSISFASRIFFMFVICPSIKEILLCQIALEYAIIMKLRNGGTRMGHIDSEMALNLLLEDAERIKRLIRNQENSLCIAQCKAFEEVVDTQMYGLSRQVAFATRLGIVDNAVGQQLMADLEKDLNQLYSEVYEEKKSTEIGKEA